MVFQTENGVQAQADANPDSMASPLPVYSELEIGIEMYGLNTSVALVGDWDIGDHSGNSETEYQKGSLLVGVTGLGSSKTLCFSYI